MSLEEFVKNRNAFPADELDQYTGQHVAWTADGTRILASDPDPLKVLAAVKALGYDPCETPIEDIPADDIFPGGDLGFQGDQGPRDQDPFLTMAGSWTSPGRYCIC
jgi:hypothetical protein